MILLAGRKERDAELWRRYDRRRRVYEREGASILRRLFTAQGRRIVDGLPADELPALAYLLSLLSHEGWTQRIYSWLFPMTEAEYRNAERTLSREAAEPFEGQRIAAEYGSRRAATLVAGIDEATREALRRTLELGTLEGWTGEQFADRIKTLYSGFSLARADRIGRTETTAAANFGSIEAAKGANIRGLKKVWLAASDGRVRPSHQEANGQERDLDVPFLVGGSNMDHPGDTNAPARETVNCRCGVIYRVPR